MKKTLVLCLFCLSWGFYLPQKEGAVPIFRISSTAVLVDFIAVDKQGVPVRDLRREEMEVFEDGKKQAIDSFYPPGQSPPSPLVSALTPAATSGRMPPAGAAVTSANAAGQNAAQTVIVIDSRAIDSNNLVHAVAAIRAFINKHLAANHAVMITEINRGLRVLTPRTGDKATLLGAVDQLKPQTVYNPLDASRATVAGAEAYLDELSLQVAYVRESLKSLCYSLAGDAGRKHVVFFSEGYPMSPVKLVEMNARGAVGGAKSSEIRQAASREVGKQKDPDVIGMVQDVVSLAHRAGVSFYAIDARGLIAVQGIGDPRISGNVAAGPGRGGGGSGTGAPEIGPSEGILAVFQLTQISRLEDAQNTLAALAAGTDGLVFFNTNNLEVVLNHSTLEQENYYLASYLPASKRKPGQFHTIAVKTTRPGVRIRSRLGYVDTPENETRATRMSYALDRPELFRQLSPLLNIEPSKGKIRAVMGIPGSQVRFRQNGYKYEAKISFQGMIYRADGKPLSKDFPISKGFNLALTAEQFQGIGNQPMLAQQEMNLAAGQYKIVLLVEDHLAGTLGTSVQEFTVL